MSKKEIYACRSIQQKRQNPDDCESGMMVVEAVLSFTVFIMVSVAIVYLTNIFIIHNRIQFAINTTAKQIASYTYLYEGLGLRDGDKKLQEDSDTYVKPIDDTASSVLKAYNDIQKTLNDTQGLADTVNDISPDKVGSVLSQIETVTDDVKTSGASIKSSTEQLSELFSDPDSLLAGVLYAAGSGGMYAIKGAVAAGAAKALTKGSLSVNGGNKSGVQAVTADEYLKSFGIKDGYNGLDFSGSTMLCDKDRRMIDIVVQYDIDMSFLSLIIPDARLHVVQRASVPAWVDGDGASLPDKGSK